MLGTSQPMAFLPSADLERSRRFFQDLLGLVLVDESPYACAFRCGGTMLRVTKVDDLQPQPFTVFGWEVTDIYSEVAQLAAQGVSLTRYDGMGQDEHGVWTTPGDDRVAWFKDPDGNTLSMTQFARG